MRLQLKFLRVEINWVKPGESRALIVQEEEGPSETFCPFCGELGEKCKCSPYPPLVNHKGEWCGRRLCLFCQEGYCEGCEVEIEYQNIQKESLRQALERFQRALEKTIE